MATKAKNQWELIEWDGNTELGFKCWRKKFGRGYVSIGVGDEFLNVSYAYGANSNDSICGTRWDYGQIISEQDMMDIVDANNGKHKRRFSPHYKTWFEAQTDEVKKALLNCESARFWHQKDIAYCESLAN